MTVERDREWGYAKAEAVSFKDRVKSSYRLRHHYNGLHRIHYLRYWKLDRKDGVVLRVEGGRSGLVYGTILWNPLHHSYTRLVHEALGVLYPAYRADEIMRSMKWALEPLTGPGKLPHD